MKSSTPTKLTLRLDSALIHGAKRCAQDQDRSLSQLVADYFAQLTAPKASAVNRAAAPPDSVALGPITSGLRGALRQPGGAGSGKALPGRDQHRAHLEEKYR